MTNQLAAMATARLRREETAAPLEPRRLADRDPVDVDIAAALSFPVLSSQWPHSVFSMALSVTRVIMENLYLPPCTNGCAAAGWC